MDHAALPDGGLIPHPDIDRLLPTEYQQQALEDLAPVSGDLVDLAAEKTDLLDLAGDKKGAVDNLYDAAGTDLFDTGNSDEMITPHAIIVGPTDSRGTVSLNIARHLSGNEVNQYGHYIHLRLPWTSGQRKMYHLQAQGYGIHAAPNYAGCLIDLKWSGYLYTSLFRYVSNHDPTGILNPTQYLSANSPYYAYLRFGPLNPYWLSFTVHSIYVGNGQVLYPGDITIIRSTSATL